MRVLIDTNILFSALVFPGSKPAQALLCAASRHKIVLCQQNIDELQSILEQKAPKRLPAAKQLFARLPYELIPAAAYAGTQIRDVKDQPILNAAIRADVDMILTGDKDFLSLALGRPRCMTAAQFLELDVSQAGSKKYPG